MLGLTIAGEYGESRRGHALVSLGLFLGVGLREIVSHYDTSSRSAVLREDNMSNENNSAERLSMRKSVLIWIGGICLGWGIATALIFSYWALSRQEPINAVDGSATPMVADAAKDAKSLNDVMPAAGTPTEKSKR
jgi:hypothetical protein